MNWRPEKEWLNPYGLNYGGSRQAYEAGASAMLSAVIKWLDADCPHCFYLFHGERKSKCKRKDCPQCLSELKEANK